MHTTANGRAYKKYTGPKGERASSLKQAWTRHEGAPGTPGPPSAPPPGTKRKRAASAAPEEGLPPPPTPPPSAAAAAAAPTPSPTPSPAHERVRLTVRGMEGAAPQLRLLPPSMLAEITHEARRSWATLMGDAAPDDDGGDGNTLALALAFTPTPTPTLT